MLPIQSIEATVPAGGAENHGESRQQKPKTLPCKYCSKRFRRVEHVQRHERTHTKEKPFACGWARCGKTFGRRDLLVRHEKLVHLQEGGKDGSRPRKPSSAGGQPGPSDRQQQVDGDILAMSQQAPQHQHAQFGSEELPSSTVVSLPPDLRLGTRAPTASLELLSNAATHIASAGEVGSMSHNMMPPGLPSQQSDLGRVKPYDEGIPYGDRGRDADAGVLSNSYGAQPGPAVADDYNLFLDDDPSSHFLPPAFEPDHTLAMWTRPPMDLAAPRGVAKSASTYPSRFPSLQPDPRDPQEPEVKPPVWRLTAMDHTLIKSRLDEFSSVLGSDFVFPSRHTLSRFLESYISGFHEQLPFLHLPTLVPTDLSPELLLAMLAVGAQYRFESHRGHALWYAAKAVALEQIRRRHSHEMHGLLPTASAYSPHSTRPSPSASYRHSFTSVHQERPMTQDTHREPYSPNTPQSRLETVQALLLLYAVGLWGAKAILHESLSLQSQLALLLREEGLTSGSTQPLDWESWIRYESGARTKLIAFCFFNLCTIAYNTPPLVLTSELNLFLPNPSRLWKAETAWQWQEARQTYPHMALPVQDAFSRLLNRPSQGPLQSVTALGNYVLIHALIQHIYLLKQTSFAITSPFELHRGIKPEDVEEVIQALKMWTMGFEAHRQIKASEGGPSMAGDSFAAGPIAFNSTALYRLAYIRLSTDLSPSKSLETRDHMVIAAAFNDAPLLYRGPNVQRAIVSAIHALSMLVKAGVSYVARTKSFEWSMQHALCNLECAVLLSKWLMTLASIGPTDPPITGDERDLLNMVRRMLDETEFAVPVDPSLSGPASGHHPSRSWDLNDTTKLRQLASAVIRLWAETFKGNHIFEVMRIMAAGLEGYADLLEKPSDRTPLTRMAAAGLG